MKKVLFLLLTLLSVDSFSEEEPLKYITEFKVGTPTTSTVTKKSFNEIPKIIFNQYRNAFKIKNIKVDLNLSWEKPWFTMWAKQHSEREYSINLWGAVTRIPGMNNNGLALFTCHEIGHILAGTPRMKIKDFLWASSEGQADYFATAICLKNYYESKA